MEENSKINPEFSESMPSDNALEKNDESNNVNLEEIEIQNNVDSKNPPETENKDSSGMKYDFSKFEEIENQELNADENAADSLSETENQDFDSENPDYNNLNNEDIQNFSENDADFNNFSQIDNQGSFEDEIDFSQQVNLEDIEKIQAQIQQSMPSEFQEITSREEEEKEEENSVLKKYIVYISKDFVPYMDTLSTNELSAYVNDAIQKKIDLEEEEHKKNKKQKALKHIITALATIFITMPILMYAANKSIMATFENYKYSQQNFEKLYEQRFSKSKTHARTLKYNKLHSETKK